jgi:molecular chaperone DnaK
MAANNKALGVFQLTGIPAAPRGVPRIEVAFDIDANGIVNVSAKDLGTGRVQNITISGSTALSDDEIDRMVKDAEAHAEEDERLRKEAEIRNNAESMISGAEATLRDLGDKASSSQKAEVEAAIAETRDAITSGDASRIETASNKLRDASYKLAESAYNGNPTQAPADGSGDDDVIDAEYEEVD